MRSVSGSGGAVSPDADPQGAGMVINNVIDVVLAVTAVDKTTVIPIGKSDRRVHNHGRLDVPIVVVQIRKLAYREPFIEEGVILRQPHRHFGNQLIIQCIHPDSLDVLALKSRRAGQRFFPPILELVKPDNPFGGGKVDMTERGGYVVYAAEIGPGHRLPF